MLQAGVPGAALLAVGAWVAGLGVVVCWWADCPLGCCCAGVAVVLAGVAAAAVVDLVEVGFSDASGGSSGMKSGARVSPSL